MNLQPEKAMPRLFIALPMPEEAQVALEPLCVGLPGVHWTPVDDFHLTLRFIGEVDHATFYEIGEFLSSVVAPPFELRLAGLGVFPPRGLPHTLWAGLEEGCHQHLMALRRRIERVLREAGVPPERRNFVPHVTLGRLTSASPEPRFAAWFARRALFRSIAFPVSAFNLYSSQLRPEGALHLLEASYDFVSGVMERA